MACDGTPNIVHSSSIKTLLCSTFIASFIGYKLYAKLIQRSTVLSGINYNDYNRILTTKSPAKIIMNGEHAVVYGITALSTAINKSTQIAIYEPNNPVDDTSAHDSSNIILKLNKAELSWNIHNLLNVYNNYNALDTDIISAEYDNGNASIKPHIVFVNKLEMNEHAYDALFSENNWDKQITLVLLSLLYRNEFIKLFNNKQFIASGVLIDVQSDIPIGVGMGSSAAWSTSLSAAIYYYYQYVITHQRHISHHKIEIDSDSMSAIWKLSYDLEIINHGTPSGIDNTTSLYGGYIKYINKTSFEVIDINKQFVHQIPLLVINTKVIGNTKLLVQNVRKLHNKYCNILDSIFESIEHIVENVITNVTDRDVTQEVLTQNINELFSMNHTLLLSIGVGHNAIHKLQSICNEYGFDHGFKITGAGGGGCCIVPLLSKHSEPNMDEIVEKFRNILIHHGYQSYLVETGQSGLYCEFN